MSLQGDQVRFLTLVFSVSQLGRKKKKALQIRSIHSQLNAVISPTAVVKESSSPI